MNLLEPLAPPYDAIEWSQRAFPERARMVCRAWALQGYGTPLAGYALYGVKVIVYIGAWIYFCGFTPGLDGLRDIGSWWLAPVAFQKAIIWSLLFEILGLGCGSGPLTGHYFPPFGGFLYFTSNVPMGVPIEWNFSVVYGAFFLFWAHPEVSVFDLGSPLLALYLVAVLVVVPLLGNFFPEKISFLLAMRYYAGNWPVSVWLFRAGSYRKLDQCLRKTSPWVYDQLERFYDRRTAVGPVGKVMGFRLMHLHGRALGMLLPKALDGPLQDYEYLDGELVAGLTLGWNFGDGHLHDERLLAALQAQCGFEAGELRCIFIESQPLWGSTLHWRIADAKTSRLHEGRVPVRELLSRQPWDEG